MSSSSSSQHLVAACGPRDPDFPAPAGAARRAGPLLRLLDERPFGSVSLVGDPFRVEACAAALRERRPDLELVAEGCDEPALAAELVRHLQRHGSTHLYLPPEHPEWQWRLVKATSDAFLTPDLMVVELSDADPAAVDVRAWRFLAAEAAREPGGAAPSSAYVSRVNRTLRLAGSEDKPEPARLRRELGLVGEDPGFLRALRACEVLAGHTVPALIRGETGTGKELFARYLHRLSGRPESAFVAVNCGALPANLVESILFGHKKGAFTGAANDQVGKFAQADGGTLFLDEIGELPLELQPKLLRVLQDGVVEPVGATQGRAVNVRVVAATHRDLRAMAAEGTFREDLYYRLAFGVVELPALRERVGDLPVLAAALLQRINRGYSAPRRLSPAALERLARHPWPGNIRELEGTLARAVMWSEGGVIEPDGLQLAPPLAPSQPALPEPHEGFSLESYLNEARERLIRRALSLAGSNQSAAARLLGLTPQAVHKFLKGDTK